MTLLPGGDPAMQESKTSTAHHFNSPAFKFQDIKSIIAHQLRYGAMKTFFYAILVVLVASTLSCNTSTPSFYIFKENDITIPAGISTIETHFFVINNINNTFQAELDSRGILADQIKSVNAGKGQFNPVFDDFDYGIMREVSIWLVSVTDPSLRKEIYYRDQIPLTEKNELRLLSGIANLKDFLLSEEKYNLEIQLKFRNFVPTELENRLTYNFAVFTE
jgi:hypothetical protein